jgi:two-component sensor histidine kinase
VPFSDYVRSLAGHRVKSPPDARVRASIDFALEEVVLPLAVAIPCGLVLNELIANALEHAFKGRPSGTVRVALSWQSGGRLRLAVSDDGVGLPEGFDVERCDSLGMQLVCALARQLQARISVEPGRGARFAMTVPVTG